MTSIIRSPGCYVGALRTTAFGCLGGGAQLENLSYWGRGFVTCADNSNVLKPGGVHPLSPAFQKNKAAMELLVEQLHQLIAKAVRGGGEKAIKRHRERGKLLPRERIDAILDPGSPFLELSQLAGHNMYGAELLSEYDGGCELSPLERNCSTCKVAALCPLFHMYPWLPVPVAALPASWQGRALMVCSSSVNSRGCG